MVFKFAAEFLHDTDSGHGGSITERAERAAEHVLRKFCDQVDILAAAQASVKTFQHLAQPGSAFTARNAPAARFVRVKMHDAARHVHHAGVFVHDHHAAGAHHAAGFGDRIVVHGQIDFVGAHQWAGTATRNNGFKLFAVGNAAGHFVDELFHVHAQRNFINAGLVDVAGYAEQARTAIFRSAAIGVSFAAFADDGRNGTESFNVIDDGRAAVETHDSREGRLDAWITAFAFERFHQSRFFTTFISAGAGMNQQIVIEAGVANIFAEITALVRLFECGFHEIEHVAIFAANIDEAAIGADGAARNDHAF